MSLRNVWTVLAAVLCTTIGSACSEQVGGSLGCPALCADQSAQLKDTTLTAAIVVDSALAGYPLFGETHDITLQNAGDSADVRFIVRFDTLPTNYTPAQGGDSVITRVDSAQLIFVIDTTKYRPDFPLTISAFDVDTVANDSSSAAVIPLFRPGRLIVTKQLDSLTKDTVKISLPSDKIFPKVRDTLHLRIGLQISGPSSRRLRVLTSSFGPRIRFRVSSDTLVKPDTLLTTSGGPADDNAVRAALTSYAVVVKGKLPAPPSGFVALGGIAGSRPYYRFDFPTQVLDSVNVLRASLLLTQTRARGTARTSDSLTVFTHPILSGANVTDLRTAFGFIGNPYAYGVDSVRLAPNDSGVKSIELVNLVRFWRTAGTSTGVRSIVLRPSEEGSTAGEILFYSLEAAQSLRPRIRLTYVPRRGFGLP